MKQLAQPPFVLVKTWLELSTNSGEKDAQQHAKRMLIKAFGSVEVAVIYMEQQGLDRSA
jgi:hypothetical protein